MQQDPMKIAVIQAIAKENGWKCLLKETNRILLIIDNNEYWISSNGKILAIRNDKYNIPTLVSNVGDHKAIDAFKTVCFLEKLWKEKNNGTETCNWVEE